MSSILIVGIGSIGRRHIENFSNHFKNIDIAEINNERIEQANKDFKINKSFNDYREALNSEYPFRYCQRCIKKKYQSIY